MGAPKARKRSTTARVTATGTAQLLLAANPDRIALSVSLANAAGVAVVRFKQASVTPAMKQGRVVTFSTPFDMPADNVYTGEISVIAESGSPVVLAIEY